MKEKCFHAKTGWTFRTASKHPTSLYTSPANLVTHQQAPFRVVSVFFFRCKRVFVFRTDGRIPCVKIMTTYLAVGAWWVNFFHSPCYVTVGKMLDSHVWKMAREFSTKNECRCMTTEFTLSWEGDSFPMQEFNTIVSSKIINVVAYI